MLFTQEVDGYGQGTWFYAGTSMNTDSSTRNKAPSLIMHTGKETLFPPTQTLMIQCLESRL